MRFNRRRKRSSVDRMGNCCPATQQPAIPEEQRGLLVNSKKKEAPEGGRRVPPVQTVRHDKLHRDGCEAASSDAQGRRRSERAEVQADADVENAESCVKAHKELKAEEKSTEDASSPLHINRPSSPVESTYANSLETSTEDWPGAGKIVDASSKTVDGHKDKSHLEVVDEEPRPFLKCVAVHCNATYHSETQAEHPSSISLPEESSAEQDHGSLVGDSTCLLLEVDLSTTLQLDGSPVDSSGEKRDFDMPKQQKTERESIDAKRGSLDSCKAKLGKKDAESAPIRSDANQAAKGRNSQLGSNAVSDPSCRCDGEQQQGSNQDTGRDAAKNNVGAQQDALIKSQATGQEVPVNQSPAPLNEGRAEPMKRGGDSSKMEDDTSELDLYRGVEEIEEERLKKEELRGQEPVADALLAPPNAVSGPEDRSSVAAEVDLLFYSQREWRGNTAKSALIRKGYEEVSHTFQCLRRVRGDNYCALRATLFQLLSQDHPLPDWLQQSDITQWPEELLATEELIGQWKFPLDHREGGSMLSAVEQLKSFLELLRKTWQAVAEAGSHQKRLQICEEVFQGGEEEYGLLEAVKFLMLRMAMKLHGCMLLDEPVPVFCCLLFARDSSDCPRTFLTNHLCHVGFSGGLEQVEMFLLGYTLQRTIKVYRLYKTKTEEFITYYPDDHKEDWPCVCLVTEDDRHYNIPVAKQEKVELSEISR
ncbi:ubiquitin thioesterase otulin [Arapaima gigas]